MKIKEEYIHIRKSEYEFLVTTTKELREDVLVLRDRVKELEGLLSKSSNNSHKHISPPAAMVIRKA